jgi:hypothetical protein
VEPETWAAVATVAAVVAALTAGAALYFNWRSARAADSAARAAEEQTKIQRQLRIDAAQPYVWVDIRPDESQGMMLDLVVGNSGPTVAEKVRVTVDPHLPSTAQLGERVKAAQTLLSDGIESLPPGRTLMWPLGAASKVINESGANAYKLNRYRQRAIRPSACLDLHRRHEGLVGLARPARGKSSPADFGSEGPRQEDRQANRTERSAARSESE